MKSTFCCCIPASKQFAAAICCWMSTIAICTLLSRQYVISTTNFFIPNDVLQQFVLIICLQFIFWIFRVLDFRWGFFLFIILRLFRWQSRIDICKLQLTFPFLVKASVRCCSVSPEWGVCCGGSTSFELCTYELSYRAVHHKSNPFCFLLLLDLFRRLLFSKCRCHRQMQLTGWTCSELCHSCLVSRISHHLVTTLDAAQKDSLRHVPDAWLLWSFQ